MSVFSSNGERERERERGLEVEIKAFIIVMLKNLVFN